MDSLQTNRQTDRQTDYEFTRNSPTLREALDGSKSGYNIASADRFLQVQAPLWEKDEGEYVINRIYAVAQKFEGHEGNELSNEDDYSDPLDMPVSDLLDFFAAADKIWETSNTQLDSLTPLNFVKKKRIKELRESIGEDVERVAEAVVYSIADKVSDNDIRLAKLIGKFESSLDRETDAEENYDASVTAYAHTAGYAGKNPSLATGAIINMASAEGISSRAENKRVKITNEIVACIRPQLEYLGIYKAIDEWIEFSN